MKSKWKIKGIDGYVFGEDGKLYKLPYVYNGKNYGIREIKKQYPNRYRINNTWYSEKQLRDKLILDENPILLFNDENLPF